MSRVRYSSRAVGASERQTVGRHMARHTKPQFTTEHVTAFFEKLREIRDIELLILKAHAGFEQLLFTAVAYRLNVSTNDLSPRLQFKMLVDLALVGSGQP